MAKHFEHRDSGGKEDGNPIIIVFQLQRQALFIFQKKGLRHLVSLLQMKKLIFDERLTL